MAAILVEFRMAFAYQTIQHPTTFDHWILNTFGIRIQALFLFISVLRSPNVASRGEVLHLVVRGLGRSRQRLGGRRQAHGIHGGMLLKYPNNKSNLNSEHATFNKPRKQYSGSLKSGQVWILNGQRGWVAKFRMGSKIWEANQLKFEQMGTILSKTIWNSDKNM